MKVACLLTLVAMASFLLTYLLRRYALSASLLDIPNERSSHSAPTPRGGGMSIVLTYLAAILCLWWYDLVAPAQSWALVGAGAWVAGIGFLDDHGHIPAKWRLLGHFIAAAWGLYWLGGVPGLSLAGMALPTGWLASVLVAIYFVWMLNLYNFMDGIDGIASLEAVSVCLGAMLLYGLLAVGPNAWILPALLATAVAGFLCWNFPPAKIFMGDAGSGFLGFILGMLSIMAAWQLPVLFWCWVILLGVFITDATVTLLRRVQRGERFYEAHRSHAYQHAALRLRSHRTVSLAVTAINLLWLLPIALLVGLGYLDAAWGLVVAYGPLIYLAFHFKAGVSNA